MQVSKKIREKVKLLKELTFSMYPDAKTELEYWSEFQLLIAIIMSAQTTDKQVNKANKEFFQILKSPEDWIKLWAGKIEKIINSIWFYKTKSKNIYKTCLKLKQDFNSSVPRTIEELTSLYWVWIKTAKVFLSIIEDASYLWVDTHVHRVLNRVWIVKTKTPIETNNKSEKIFTTDDLAKLHHSLIFFWRYHCTARNPKCIYCGLKEICDYYEKTYL